MHFNERKPEWEERRTKQIGKKFRKEKQILIIKTNGFSWVAGLWMDCRFENVEDECDMKKYLKWIRYIVHAM